MSFEQLGLNTELLRALEEQGYHEPTPIQSKAIPVILKGGDVFAGAQTGTGKTAGFTLPILQQLNQTATGKNRNTIRALILAPTRELASQVDSNIKNYSRFLKLKSMPIFGGVKFNTQLRTLSRGVNVMVATPGRLLDHLQQQTIDLSQIEILVLDEADRMLDMGFIHDIRKIISHLPKQKQTLLFSATFSSEIRKLSKGLLNNPAVIEIEKNNNAAELIEQIVHPVEKSRKREMLSHMIGSQNWQQVLVFTRTKHGADRLAKQLSMDGIKSIAIHGNKTQGARSRALKDFKQNNVRVLVATDIAARGLDIQQLPHVVNFELPNVSEDYVHRIGRTGRAGNKGIAISLVSSEEQKLLKDIQRLLKKQLPVEVIEGYQSTAASKSDGRRHQQADKRSNKSKNDSSWTGKGRRYDALASNSKNHRTRPRKKSA